MGPWLLTAACPTFLVDEDALEHLCPAVLEHEAVLVQSRNDLRRPAEERLLVHRRLHDELALDVALPDDLLLLEEGFRDLRRHPVRDKGNAEYYQSARNCY